MQDVLLDDVAFDRIRTYVYDQARIRLGDNKRDLVRARLAKRLRITGAPSYGAYMDLVLSGPTGTGEATALLDAISTNKTDFFRENDHFLYLAEEILPEITALKHRQGRPRLRIWSAACSSGEEPYSLAITLLEHLDRPDRWNAKILATDINTEMLARAKAGAYSEGVAASIPLGLRQRYFQKEKDAKGRRCFVATPALRRLVTVRRLNLMEPRFPFQGKFDVIFCRNVMIYFDKATQADLVRRFHDVLEPHGYLFIGHSESLLGTEAPFRYTKPTIYRRK